MAEIDDELLTEVWSTLHQCRCAFENREELDSRDRAALCAVNGAIELLEEAYGKDEQAG